ncbi:hypothetical protein HDU98_003987 [Podochytrium sp. JEL0797]|nr:hypothetical protein HDU98_003987 [Podochytrium sp. JEL0797]
MRSASPDSDSSCCCETATLFVMHPSSSSSDVVQFAAQLKAALFPFLFRVLFFGTCPSSSAVFLEVLAAKVDEAKTAIASFGATGSVARKAQLARLSQTKQDAIKSLPSKALVLNVPSAIQKNKVATWMLFYKGFDAEKSDPKTAVFEDALSASMAREHLKLTTNFNPHFDHIDIPPETNANIDPAHTAIHIKNIPPSTYFEDHPSQREKNLWGRVGVPAAIFSLLSSCGGFKRIHYGGAGKQVHAEFIDPEAAHAAFQRLSATCPKFTLTLCPPPPTPPTPAPKPPTPFLSLLLNPPGLDPLDARGLFTHAVHAGHLTNIVLSSKKTSAIAEFSSVEYAVRAVEWIRTWTNLAVEYVDTAMGSLAVPGAEESVSETGSLAAASTSSKPAAKQKTKTATKSASKSTFKQGLLLTESTDSKESAISSNLPRLEFDWIAELPKVTPSPKLDTKKSMPVETPAPAPPATVTTDSKLPDSNTSNPPPSINLKITKTPKSTSFVVHVPEKPSSTSTAPPPVPLGPNEPLIEQYTTSTRAPKPKPNPIPLAARQAERSIPQPPKPAMTVPAFGFTVTAPPLEVNMRELCVREPGFLKLVFLAPVEGKEVMTVWFKGEAEAKQVRGWLGKVLGSGVVGSGMLGTPILKGNVEVGGAQGTPSSVFKFRCGVEERYGKGKDVNRAGAVISDARVHQLVGSLEGLEGLLYGTRTVFVRFGGVEDAGVA